MPDLRLTACSPLAGLAVATPGASARIGVAIAELGGLALAGVAARRHAMETLLSRAREIFGIELPAEPRRRSAGSLAFAWAGCGRWLAVAEGVTGHALAAQLQTALSGLASISDQTDGHVILRIGGPGARATLAKGLPIDLHPRAFQTGDVAVSAIGHVGVHLWQLSDEPTYALAVPVSFARGFWHWITTSAAEFGIAVEAPPCIAAIDDRRATN